MAARVTRRGLLKQQAIAGAGIFAGGALLPLDAAAAGGEVAVQPRFYPLPGFAPELDLRGKTAVVTGASTGIGRATGEALAAQGVEVIGTSRDVASVRRRPGFKLIDLDIADTKSIDSFAKSLRRHLGKAGRLDILVNNAGRGIVGGVLPPARGVDRYFRQLDLGVRTNYTGHVVLTRKLLPVMPGGGYARVYFTITAEAYRVATGSTTYLHGYTSTKRALLAFANAWRSDLQRQNGHIGVATLNPYLVDTRFADNLILLEKPRPGTQVSAYLEAMRQLWRKGLPASMVADAFVQLLSAREPPVNVAVGSDSEPFATMGFTGPFNAELLAENDAAALPLR